MNISKAKTLIVKNKDGEVITRIEIGMIQLAKMNDKTEVLTIQQSKN